MKYELTKDLLTGNSMIDQEHRELFRMTNELIEACHKGDALAAVRPTALFLMEYVAKHFKHEEELMEQGAYPDMQAHREFHEQYKVGLREVLLQIPVTGAGPADVANIAGQMSVLISHVKSGDKKMCAYLSAGK